MHKLSLTKTHVAGNGSLHVQVVLNGSDIGLLYLTPHEAHTLTAILKKGIVETDTDLRCNLMEDDYDEELYFDEDID